MLLRRQLDCCTFLTTVIALMVQLPAGRTRAFGEPLLVLLGVFFAIGVAVTLPSLGYPWFHDDLHLVRPYLPSEVASTLAGPWDPDGIETAGYRPLTTAFNAARAALLGDSVVAHRLLEIALVAAFLAV